MRVLSSLLAAFAAFVAALLVVPVGTAGAAPSNGMQVGPGQITLSQDGQTVLVKLSGGKFQASRSGDALEVVNRAGKVTDRVPLTMNVDGTAVRVGSNLAADRASVALTPVVVAKKKPKSQKAPKSKQQPKSNVKSNGPKSKNGKKGPKGKSKRMTKGQAWDAMWKQLEADWPCASGYIGGGALLGAAIGAVLGVVIFSLVFAAYGAYIGAYIGTILGYTECNKGAGRKAYEKWMATP